jgi:activating signal cointegrator 1
MKALSLWQPHALAIGIGLKPWETRDWPTNYRGPLAIHAAKRYFKDDDIWSQAATLTICRRLFPSCQGVTVEAARILIASSLVYGAVVCTCELVDCVPTHKLRGKLDAGPDFWGDFSDGEKGAGRYAFKLENVQQLEQPVPWRGLQGFFDVQLAGEAPAQQREQMSLFGGML